MTNVEKSQLDRLEAAILGNGHEGLLVRVARMEATQIAAKEAAEAAKEASERSFDSAESTASKALQAVNNLVIKTTEMNSLVRSHIETEHFSEMMKKKEFWVIVVIGFIILHTIASYLPGGWDWLISLLGLPQLHIPVL